MLWNRAEEPEGAVEITRGKMPADIGRTDLASDLGREPSVRFAGSKSRHDGVGVFEPTLSHEEHCPLELHGRQPRRPRTVPAELKGFIHVPIRPVELVTLAVDSTERKVGIDDRRVVLDSDSPGYVERMLRQLLPSDQPPLGRCGQGHDAGHGYRQRPSLVRQPTTRRRPERHCGDRASCPRAAMTPRSAPARWSRRSSH